MGKILRKYIIEQLGDIKKISSEGYYHDLAKMIKDNTIEVSTVATTNYNIFRDEHNWSFKKWILIRDEKIGKLGLLVIKWPKKGQTIPMRIIKCKILGC